MMDRRVFLSGSLAFLGRPRVTEAQPIAKVARVGWLGRSAGKESPTFKAFSDGLRDLGYVSGENVVLVVRTPDQDRVEQYPEVASRLVADGVDVILASNPYALEAATRATTVIPVIAVDFESDPVAKGWVTSLARPGGNVTGFFLDIPEITGKQLQILRELKRGLSRVAALGDARVNDPQFHAADIAASESRLTIERLPVGDLDEVPKALAEAARRRAGGLLVLSSPMMFTGMQRIAATAMKYRLPAISLFVPFFADAGGLLAYGPSFLDPFRRAATYVDRVLKGAQPAQLPVQRPSKFEFVVNTKTARALGLTIPPPLLLRADQVIE
jgi:putative ABC transport system substrate-binding protein